VESFHSNREEAKEQPPQDGAEVKTKKRKRTNERENSSQSNRPSSSKITNIITKFSFATKGGISASNPFKVNQDAYITNPHIMGLRHCHFFAVCDGHGSNGREVSSFMKHRLPQTIEKHLKNYMAGHDLSTYPKLRAIEQSFLAGFAETNLEVSNMGTDVRFSGSTCVSLLTYGRHLYVGNVGDSRAILIKQNGDDVNSKCSLDPDV